MLDQLAYREVGIVIDADDVDLRRFALKPAEITFLHARLTQPSRQRVKVINPVQQQVRGEKCSRSFDLEPIARRR